jgi:AraC-like DNA-binding protein
MQATKFVIDPGWQVLLKDLGVDSKEVLKRAQLPGDILNRKDAALSAPEYYRLWKGLEETFDDPSFPLRLGQAVPVEAFHPAIFAALCSPNLNVGLTRLSHFKRLVGPMTLDVKKNFDSTTVSLDCLDRDNPLPASLISMELVFLVQLVRIATREHIKPLSVTTSVAILEIDKYTEFFSVSPASEKSNSLTFSASDARYPFVTENERMWNFFEPELRQRLSDMDPEEGFATRVRSSLLELLPSGQSSIDAVAKKLMISIRTLQRRLSEESTNFQEELTKTREKLARYYLFNSELSGAEISYLLGYEDSNSFFRAFHSWTGQTPGQLRMSHYSPGLAS